MQALKLKANVNQNGQLIVDSNLPSGEVEVIVLYIDDGERKTSDISITQAIKISNQIHKTVKERIAKRHPKSNISDSDEARRKFDHITEKVRKNMCWKDLDEMENAMRGEDFGLVRY